MSEIRELIETLVAFRDARDWQQFHDSKNLAVALSMEAAELNEVFLWEDVLASEEVDKAKIKEELADVFAYALLLVEKLGLDVKDILLEKIAKNSPWIKKLRNILIKQSQKSYYEHHIYR